MIPALPKGYTKFGAQMGRRDSIVDPDAPIKFQMVRLRWVDGDYDQGGAYWGRTAGTHIYRAYGLIESDAFEMFVRASSRNDAKAQVRKAYPLARFYR